MTPQEAANIIIDATPAACKEINEFSHEKLRTRLGRLGSGMGTLLEALWGYYMNLVLQGKGNEPAQCEIGWMPEHEYNDFACIQRDQPWIPESRTGELLRIEAKSMNCTGVDESKGHFDEIIERLGEWDLLLVLAWSWEVSEDKIRLYPHIQDHFIGSARSVARLRDILHTARGGSFVDRNNCPDNCPPEICRHHGEPLNSAGKRERRGGPETRKPSGSLYAANFGGLVRMLKTRGAGARQKLLEACAADSIAAAFHAFIRRNFSARLDTESENIQPELFE